MVTKLFRKLFWHQPSSSRRGFTLLELLVVIAIISVLATLIYGGFGEAKQKARDTKRKSDLSQLQRALELYYNDKGLYPLGSSGKIVVSDGGAGTVALNWGTKFGDIAVAPNQVYMVKLPIDPSANAAYSYESTDGKSYALFALLENMRDPAIVPYGSGTGEYQGVSCGCGNCNYGVSSPNVTITNAVISSTSSCSSGLSY